MMMDTSDQGRFHELEPIGVIDIGSNSVRLVVYEGAVRAPFPIYNEKTTIRNESCQEINDECVMIFRF